MISFKFAEKLINDIYAMYQYQSFYYDQMISWIYTASILLNKYLISVHVKNI